MTVAFIEQQREIARRHMARMIATGPGVHAYLLHRARELEADDAEVHAGLVEFVKRTLGPDATKRAEQDIVALLGKDQTKKVAPRQRERVAA